jgi:hypothetical protein
MKEPEFDSKLINRREFQIWYLNQLDKYDRAVEVGRDIAWGSNKELYLKVGIISKQESLLKIGILFEIRILFRI